MPFSQRLGRPLQRGKQFGVRQVRFEPDSVSAHMHLRPLRIIMADLPKDATVKVTWSSTTVCYLTDSQPRTRIANKTTSLHYSLFIKLRNNYIQPEEKPTQSAPTGNVSLSFLQNTAKITAFFYLFFLSCCQRTEVECQQETASLPMNYSFGERSCVGTG